MFSDEGDDVVCEVILVKVMAGDQLYVYSIA